MENKYLFSAGILMILIAILHLVGGQITLVDPMIDSNMIQQEKVEWLGAWHCISILLFYFGYVLLKNGKKQSTKQTELIKFIAYMCLLFSISFIGSSIFLQKHAPQYILFIPMAVILYFGLKKMEINTTTV